MPKSARLQGTQVWRDPETNTFYAQDGAGKILASASTAQSVIQTAVDAQGFIRIHSGTYQNTATWNLSSDTYVQLMPNTLISVPNAATHPIWRLYSGQASNVKVNTTIDGGRYLEGGSTPARNWTIVQMEVDRTGVGSDDGGIHDCTVKNIYTKYCGKMIHLKTSGVVQGGFINDNLFENCWADFARNAVHFEAAAQPRLAAGTHVNTFTHVCCQDDPSQTYPLENGFKDIGGYGNMFVGCHVWDITGASVAIPCNLSAATSTGLGAHQTTFIGCDMFRFPHEWEINHDKGANTVIINGIKDEGSALTSGVLPEPMIRAWGAHMGVGSTATNSVGVGLIDGIPLNGTGTLSHVIDANGLCKRMDTGATINTQTGVLGTLVHARGLNTFAKIRVKLNSLADCRALFGFVSAAPVLTADDPLNAKAGFAFAFSSTSTVSAVNWLLIRNDGTGATNIQNMNIAATTNPITFYFQMVDFTGVSPNPFIKGRIGYNDATARVTTDIPAQYTPLQIFAGLNNNVGSSKTLDLYSIFVKQDSGGA